MAAVGYPDGLPVLSGLAVRTWCTRQRLDRAHRRVATRKPAPAPHSIAHVAGVRAADHAPLGRADRADDVAAVVSELLTNAFRHALPRARQASASVPPWPVRLGLLHRRALCRLRGR